MTDRHLCQAKDILIRIERKIETDWKGLDIQKMHR
jgi:hypothetical protein